ncbi:MAG: SRPBCC family protein [Cyanobacteria bacterium P01_H01_bin.152]
MSLLVKLIGGLVGLLMTLFALGFVLPSTVHVERDTLINAPPAAVFPWVSDFTRWEAWSPWATKDPEAMMQIAGSGLGQTMRWQSENPEVGSGSQTIVERLEGSLLKTHLEFGDRGRADATFKLQPQDGKTLITWSLDTDMRDGVPTLQQPISTYVGFFMDAMIGKDYEAGLQHLQAIVEANNAT